LAFLGRPAGLIRAAGKAGLSRFSRMERACMPWFSDRAGPSGDSRLTPPAVLPSAKGYGVGTPEW